VYSQVPTVNTFGSICHSEQNAVKQAASPELAEGEESIIMNKLFATQMLRLRLSMTA